MHNATHLNVDPRTAALACLGGPDDHYTGPVPEALLSVTEALARAAARISEPGKRGAALAAVAAEHGRLAAALLDPEAAEVCKRQAKWLSVAARIRGWDLQGEDLVDEAAYRLLGDLPGEKMAA